MKYEEWKADYRICGFCANWDRVHQERKTLYPGFADYVAKCAVKPTGMTCASNGDGCMQYAPNELAKLALGDVNGEGSIQIIESTQETMA